MAQLLIIKTLELEIYEAVKWRLVTCEEVDQGGKLRDEAIKIIGDRTLLLAEGATIAPPSPYKVDRSPKVGVEFALVVTLTTKWGENTFYPGGKKTKKKKRKSGSSDSGSDEDEGGIVELIKD